MVSLHSFSKDLAIPGYRVGAVVASAALNREVTKLLDCVAICAPRIGQEAAWAGLIAGGRWRRDRAREVALRRQWFVAAMADRPGGFELLSGGGFFGWVRHPFSGRPTADVVRRTRRRLRHAGDPRDGVPARRPGHVSGQPQQRRPRGDHRLRRAARRRWASSVDDAAVRRRPPGPRSAEVAGDVQPLEPPVGCRRSAAWNDLRPCTARKLSMNTQSPGRSARRACRPRSGRTALGTPATTAPTSRRSSCGTGRAPGRGPAGHRRAPAASPGRRSTTG